MKIAIPTNDGLTIAKEFESAGGFLVKTFKNGDLVKEELRKLRFSELINFEESYQDKVKDCQYIYVRKIDEEFLDALKEIEIQCIKTQEELISKIVFQVKDEALLKTA